MNLSFNSWKKSNTFSLVLLINSNPTNFRHFLVIQNLQLRQKKNYKKRKVLLVFIKK
jgi:hypothetical protein